MLIKEPKTFYDSVKPIIYFNCFCGMGVHGQLNLSDTVYFYMRIYLVIANLVIWNLTYIGLATMRSSSKLSDDSFNNDRMAQLLVYTNLCTSVISPLFIWFRKKEFAECLQRMSSLDEIFHRVLGVRHVCRKKYISLTCQVLVIIIVVWFVCLCDIPGIIMATRTIFQSFCMAVTLHYPVIVMLVSDLNFCVFASYLRNKFQNTNESLLGLAGKPLTSAFHTGCKIFRISRKVTKVEQDGNTESLAYDNRYLLHEIRRVHLELCKLSRMMNVAFGIQNLISIGVSFFMVTGMLYTTWTTSSCGHLTTDKLLRRIVPSIIWSLLYMFKIWVVNHSSWTVSQEAKRTGHVIYELLDSARTDEELRKEILEFAVQMLQNPVQFDACGFFTLDYESLQAAIGSITTYLVILIQMAHLSESSKVDKSFPWNSTTENSITNFTKNFTR